MDERDKWWLQPLMSYGYTPVATTGLLQSSPQVTQPTIGLTQANTDYGTGTKTWEEILNPQGVQTQDQNRLRALGFGDPAVTITDDPYAAPRVDPTYALPTDTQSIDKSRWDMLPAVPGTGGAIPMPNMEVDEPLTTGLIPASMTMTPAQINAGMAEVDSPFFSRFPLAEQGMDQGTFDAIQHIDLGYGGESVVSNKDPSIRSAFKAIIGALPNVSFVNDMIALAMRSGIPGTGFSGDKIETATTAESLTDVMNNLAILDAKRAGIPKEDLIQSVVTGVNPLITTNQNVTDMGAVLSPLYAASDYVTNYGGKLDRDDARQMAFQVDEFLGTIPATTPSTISKVSRPSTKKAAVGTKTNKAEEAEKARMRALAKQQAAAQRKQDIAKAKAAKAQEAMVQAALERAAQAQAERAMVDKARALIDKYSGRREPAENYMSAEERNIVAAANVDTFAGMGDRTGEVREAMRSVGYGGSNWT